MQKYEKFGNIVADGQLKRFIRLLTDPPLFCFLMADLSLWYILRA